MATLKEIAAKAGVSVMAVSAVMNATTSTRVSEKKRALIRQVAEEMGYQSNVIARTLRGGSSRMLGVTWRVDPSRDEDTFFARLGGTGGDGLAHVYAGSDYHQGRFDSSDSRSSESPYSTLASAAASKNDFITLNSAFRSAAQQYLLRQFGQRPWPACRFDVVVIEAGVLEWIRAAF